MHAAINHFTPGQFGSPWFQDPNKMKIWLKVGLIVANVYQVVVSSSAQTKPGYSKPFLTCFDGTLKSFTIGAESVPDLRKKPYFFDNLAVKCVVNGVYILYGNYHFNAFDGVSQALFLCALFLSKMENGHLFSSSLPRFDKCHKSSRIFIRTE